jgi:hypothetical protein
MVANKSLPNDVGSVLTWLEHQDEKEAHCAKKIIQNKSVSSLRVHITDILDWLVEKSQTNKSAGQAYSIIMKMAKPIENSSAAIVPEEEAK